MQMANTFIWYTMDMPSRSELNHLEHTMPRPKKASSTPRRESPIQFRPGTELGQLVTDFSRSQGLKEGEACRRLIALAVTGMDGRYYPLIRQFAEGAGPARDFVRACAQVKSMVDGAALAGADEVGAEPGRSRFIFRIVKEALTSKGIELEAGGLWFATQAPAATPVAARSHATDPGGTRPRRVVRPLEPEAASEDEPGTATVAPPVQRRRVST